eukprot:5537491-Amphidinium_carterae.1
MPGGSSMLTFGMGGKYSPTHPPSSLLVFGNRSYLFPKSQASVFGGWRGRCGDVAVGSGGAG